MATQRKTATPKARASKAAASDPIADATASAKTWAELARALNVNGKTLRAFARRQGWYVSKDAASAFTPDTRAVVVAHFTRKASTDAPDA